MKKNGFTLIEILVSATIVAVMAVVGVASYTSINQRSRNAKRKSDLEQVRSALEMYRVDTGSYPGTTSTWSQMSTELSVLIPTYMPSIPDDPKPTTGHQYYYYRPLGAGPPFYSYCVAAWMENQVGVITTCGAGGPGGITCNYGLKNP